MTRILRAVQLPFKSGLTLIMGFLEQPVSRMNANRAAIAERRRNRVEGVEGSYLWCWQHRGFW